jgi:hypothetical protein
MIKKKVAPKKAAKKTASKKPALAGHNCACCTALCGNRK